MADQRAKYGPRARTMADIARLAGVSESTVSRALADSPLVNRATKDKVRRVAADHAYVVNERARSFRLKRTRTIAVVIPLPAKTEQPISDPFFLELLGGIADALNARGYDLLLSRVEPQSRGWSKAMMDANRADGTILIGQVGAHETINALAGGGAPFVVWGGLLDGQQYCTVGCDNRLGARLVTAHLLGMGRRRPVFIGDRALPEVALRYEGFCRAMGEAGLAPDAAAAFDARFISRAAHDIVLSLLDRGTPFDAVVAASDVLAMGAIAALEERGLNVPRDIAVTGFDDISVAQWYNPPLTTVRQHIGQGARLLVDMLMARIAGEAVSPVIMPPKLMVRASCGAPYQKETTMAAARASRPSDKMR